jgi:murein DD-endopeptidase MepM/ murein hydrolase activator NlpD
VASQAPAYGALLVGGVALVAAVKGAKFTDVLAGRKSPIRPLTSSIPTSFESGTAAGSSSPPAGGGAGATLTSHGYVAPVGAGWTPERTDQGVDFAPAHTGVPIVSPGNAKVVKIGAPGWPSGEKGVVLQLLDGPLKGRHIFIYEAIQPTVKVGQIVRAGEKVGEGVFGETGIEIGFSDAAGTPLSHTEYEQHEDGFATVWGKKMRQWLTGLGVPK